MTAIPENTVTQADLTAWYDMTKKLTALKAAEMLLRTKIFKHYFPNPVEGTNTVAMPDIDGLHYAMKATYPITRKVLEAELTILAPLLLEKGVPVGSLIKHEPSLVLANYRELTKEQAAMFDQVLEIKPGSPSIKIEQVKRVKA